MVKVTLKVYTIILVYIYCMYICIYIDSIYIYIYIDSIYCIYLQYIYIMSLHTISIPKMIT